MLFRRNGNYNIINRPSSQRAIKNITNSTRARGDKRKTVCLSRTDDRVVWRWKVTETAMTWLHTVWTRRGGDGFRSLVIRLFRVGKPDFERPRMTFQWDHPVAAAGTDKERPRGRPVRRATERVADVDGKFSLDMIFNRRTRKKNGFPRQNGQRNSHSLTEEKPFADGAVWRRGDDTATTNMISVHATRRIFRKIVRRRAGRTISVINVQTFDEKSGPSVVDSLLFGVTEHACPCLCIRRIVMCTDDRFLFHIFIWNGRRVEIDITKKGWSK